MINFNALFRLCRTVRVVSTHTALALPNTTIKTKFHVQNYCSSQVLGNLNLIGKRTMSQKITSFFKITPKKTTDAKEDNKQNDEQRESPNTSDIENNLQNTPLNNGKGKRSSKRHRLDSSSDSNLPELLKQDSPVNSDKKKKSKRQRIESSESETEIRKSEERESGESQIKLEKTSSPRTYSSPKNRKNKVKVEKSSPIKKVEKSSPIKKVETAKVTCDSSPKKVKEEETASPEVESDKSPSPKKQSPSPKKESPSSKKKVSKKKSPVENGKSKEPKKLSSFFVKKEKAGDPIEAESKEVAGAASKKMTSFFIRKAKPGDKTEAESEAAGVPEDEYDPSQTKYDPVSSACWANGQPVPYLALARTLAAIEATSGRLRIIDTLANYFRSVIAMTPDDLLPSVYMCLNQLAPAYKGLELGIAETYLMKAVGACTGQTLAQTRALCRKAGDLGSVAEKARAMQRTMLQPKPLTVRAVFAALKDIANMTGKSSVDKKIAKIQTLYTACRMSEARYLIRSLEGKLRIGLAEQSVLSALAAAAARTPPSLGEEQVLDAAKGVNADQFKTIVDEHAHIIKSTYCECPDYDQVIPALLKHGVRALPEHCRLTPGLPLKPMLAHPTKGLAEVFNRFEGTPFTCEFKYDGERAQIHVPALRGTDEGEETRADLAKAAVFSRNQEDNTSKYPDILRRLGSLLKESVSSCVLDAEAVAYDVTNQQILPFQILSTRKRKDAVESEIKVQVCVFVFDLLYLNGRPLVKSPLRERRELLREHFNEVKGEWQFASGQDCTSSEEVQLLLDEAIRGCCEGLMVKTLEGDNARYDIARRSHNWLKVKKDYLEGCGDSIDAAVLGAWWGRGKRAGLLGGFLLGCRDADTEEFQSLCKIGTGFSDEDLQTLTEKLKEHIIEAPRPYYRWDPSHTPDVWVSATQVWEIRCADLSLSPAHRAAIGLVDPDKGISLRFPRFIRVRDDKPADAATSARQIAAMYLAQDQVRSLAPRALQEDEFY